MTNLNDQIEALSRTVNKMLVALRDEARDATTLLDRSVKAATQCGQDRAMQKEEIARLHAQIRQLQDSGPTPPPDKPTVPDPVPDPEPDPPVIVDPPAEPDPRAFRAKDWVNADPGAAFSIVDNKLAARPKNRQKVTGFDIRPGAPKDFGDLDILAEWQWAHNVHRNPKDGSKDISAPLDPKHSLNIRGCSFAPGPTPIDTRVVGEDGELVGDPPFDPQVGMKWGMRRYNLGDTTVSNCEFLNIPQEHGLYDNLSGHAYYWDLLFKNLGSQAMQVASRHVAYAQYGPDNLPFTGKATIIVDDCHVQNSGNGGTRPSSALSFFDPGSLEFPAALVLRGSSVVHRWPVARMPGDYTEVAIGTKNSIRGLRAVTVHQYQTRGEGQATENFVAHDCLFDITSGDGSLLLLRGIDTILLSESVFIARDHSKPYVDVDDAADANSSNWVVLQDCLSPKAHEVFLRIRGKVVMYAGHPLSLNCPGERFVIDVKTLKVVQEPMKDEPMTRVISPLKGRVIDVASGLVPVQVANPDIGTVALDFAPLAG